MELINVMASTLDGKIGAAPDESDSRRFEVGITSNADQKFLRSWVESCDAIIVGATSIRANGKCLDFCNENGGFPEWYIYSRGAIAKDTMFWRQGNIPRTLVSPVDLPVYDSKVELFVYGDSDPVMGLLEHMANKGHKRVLLFGGGVLNSLFYNRGVVSRLELALAPLFLGKAEASNLMDPSLANPVHFTLRSSYIEDGFLFLSYAVCS